jgi:hypothetical protein
MKNAMASEVREQHKRRVWPHLLAGGSLIAAFCGLVLWGLAWGIPSQRRAQLEGASAELRKLRREVIQKSWLYWGSRGRRSQHADQFPRHLFNPLRSYHPDEYQVFKSLSNMNPRKLDFDPGNYIYPSLHTYLVGAAVGACALVGAVRLETALDYYLDHPDELGRMYLVGRALSLVAAAAALVLVWVVGEKMGRGTGLLALALLAAMPALGIHAHNLTRNTSAALAIVLFFICCRKVVETGAARWYDIAGGAAGLCVAFQYFAVALWVLVPLAALLRLRRSDDTTRSALTGVLVSLVVMAAVFCLTCPYHLRNADQFLADFRSETVHVGGGVVARLASLGWATHLPRMMPALLTWPMTVAIGLGVVVALVRRQPDDWLLLALLVVWAGIVGYDGRVYSRYYVPILPVMALLGARGLMAIWEATRRVLRIGWARALVGIAVLGAVLGPAWALTWAWSRLYSRENVRTLAGEWIASRVPKGARIGVTKWPWQFEMPPIDPGKYRLVVLEDLARGSAHDLERLWQEKPDYFVTSSIQFGTIPYEGEQQNEIRRFWHFVLTSGSLYRIVGEFRVPHPILGADLSGYPEDMRYVNPVIYVLERLVGEARRRQTGRSA